MSATIDALRAELGAGPLLYRYSGAGKDERVRRGVVLGGVGAPRGRPDGRGADVDGHLVPLRPTMSGAPRDDRPERRLVLGNLPQGPSLALIEALDLEEDPLANQEAERSPTPERQSRQPPGARVATNWRASRTQRLRARYLGERRPAKGPRRCAPRSRPLAVARGQAGRAADKVLAHDERAPGRSRVDPHLHVDAAEGRVAVEASARLGQHCVTRAAPGRTSGQAPIP